LERITVSVSKPIGTVISIADYAAYARHICWNADDNWGGDAGVFIERFAVLLTSKGGNPCIERSPKSARANYIKIYQVVRFMWCGGRG